MRYRFYFRNIFDIRLPAFIIRYICTNHWKVIQRSLCLLPTSLHLAANVRTRNENYSLYDHVHIIIILYERDREHDCT